MSKVPEGLKCEVTPEDAYPNGVPAIPDGWEFVAFVRAPALYSMALLTNGEVEGISTATSMWGRPCIVVRRKQKCSWCKDTGVIEVPSIMVPDGMYITNKPCEHCQPKPSKHWLIEVESDREPINIEVLSRPTEFTHVRHAVIGVREADIKTRSSPKPTPKPFRPDCGSVQHGTSVCPRLQAEAASFLNQQREQAEARAAAALNANPRMMRHPSDPVTNEAHPENEGCSRLGCKPVQKVRARRFLIEDDPGGLAIRPGQPILEAFRDAKIIREVKPLPRRDIENLYFQANRQSRMEDGVEVMAGYLSRLGIEVGD